MFKEKEMKNYKGKLKERSRRLSKIGMKSIGSSTSSVPIEAIDLSADFFSEDVVLTADTPDSQGEIRESGYFGPVIDGFTLPCEANQHQREISSTTDFSARRSVISSKSFFSEYSGDSETPVLLAVAPLSLPSKAHFVNGTHGSYRADIVDRSEPLPPMVMMRSQSVSDSLRSMSVSDGLRSNPFRQFASPLDAPPPSHYSTVHDQPFLGPSTLHNLRQLDGFDTRTDPFSRMIPPASRDGPPQRPRRPSAYPSPRTTLTLSGSTQRAATIPEMDVLDQQTFPPVKEIIGVGYRHSVLKEHLENLTYVDGGSAGRSSMDSTVRSYETNSSDASYEPKHKIGYRSPKRWYGRWSTREIILLVVGIFSLIALGLGLGIGIWQNSLTVKSSITLSPTWRPALGNTWQIKLNSPLKVPAATVARVYDIDMFDNTADTIAELHKQGRKVICYISAGTYEARRSDATKFVAETLGGLFQNSNSSRWIDTRTQTVRDIMTARVKIAAQKGCDGIDFDHVDGYSHKETTFGLTQADGVAYVRYLATAAHTLSLAVGLRNSPELINGTLDVVEFQINEGCAQRKECGLSHPFVQSGKPVFHIEYSSGSNVTALNTACNADGSHMFSTLLKRNVLDIWSIACPIGDPKYEMDY